ncbi:DUF4293 domain-containing protein [Neolewinella antarctica]|uniref:Glucan phosphoethanolaminetransferase (Alkaline phosphatase superfamily) n=1 Tax=Neolewinella antarctica TaxID=442734 RepID=A0ABX0X9Z5_9BACT|nr:DUF4293 domain-containing protein [Neolewinella antarctica]NJC26081.1 glucan phosphoethanolaminetransferase (alkaline phosphatase superfamily) [Neolewinella antarctica]
MIQRIQSIFLFLGAVLCFVLFFTDVADTPAPMETSSLFADAQFTLFDDPILLVLFGLAGVLLLVNIFLFNNRKLQMTLSLVAILLVVLGAGYGAFRFFTDVAAGSATPDFGLILPLLAIIFGWLARNNIKKDEKLVRSADRLR